MSTDQKKPVSDTTKALAVTCAAAIALCTPFVAGWEGKKNASYRDIVGVVTACYGHTGPELRMGQVFDDTQCRRMLEGDIGLHMEGVLSCAPGLVQRPNQLAAATSLTFNIGVRAFCGSTAARRFNAGDLKGACDAFLPWNRAGGRVVQGLANRRAAERNLCLKGL